MTETRQADDLSIFEIDGAGYSNLYHITCGRCGIEERFHDWDWVMDWTWTHTFVEGTGMFLCPALKAGKWVVAPDGMTVILVDAYGLKLADYRNLAGALHPPVRHNTANAKNRARELNKKWKSL